MMHVSPQCAKCGEEILMRSLLAKLALGAFKCIAGILSRSVALTVDGFFSVTGGVETIFILADRRVGSRMKDGSPQVEHGRAMTVASLVVLAILIVIGVLYFFRSLHLLVTGRERAPIMFGFLAALASVVANYMLYKACFCTGTKVCDPAVVAMGHENLKGFVASVPVAAGIAVAQFGFRFSDPLAGVLISLALVADASYTWWQALNKLLDRAAPAALRDRIGRVALASREDLSLGRVRSRFIGSRLWIDLELLVPARWSVCEASRVASQVRYELLESFTDPVDVEVYCHPAGGTN